MVALVLQVFLPLAILSSSDGYVLFAANVDDFRTLAKKFGPNLADHLAGIVSDPSIKYRHGQTRQKYVNEKQYDVEQVPDDRGKEKYSILEKYPQISLDEIVEKVKDRIVNKYNNKNKPRETEYGIITPQDTPVVQASGEPDRINYQNKWIKETDQPYVDKKRYITVNNDRVTNKWYDEAPVFESMADKNKYVNVAAKFQNKDVKYEEDKEAIYDNEPAKFQSIKNNKGTYAKYEDREMIFDNQQEKFESTTKYEGKHNKYEKNHAKYKDKEIPYDNEPYKYKVKTKLEELRGEHKEKQAESEKKEPRYDYEDKYEGTYTKYENKYANNNERHPKFNEKKTSYVEDDKKSETYAKYGNKHAKYEDKDVKYEENSKHAHDPAKFDSIEVKYEKLQGKHQAEESKAIFAREEVKDVKAAVNKYDRKDKTTKKNQYLNVDYEENNNEDNDDDRLYKKIKMQMAKDSYEDYVTPKKDDVFETYEATEATKNQPDTGRNDKLVQRLSKDTFSNKDSKYSQYLGNKHVPTRDVYQPAPYMQAATTRATIEEDEEETRSPKDDKARTESLLYDYKETDMRDDGNERDRNIMKGTKVPTRYTVRISSPNYYKNLPTVVEKYNFDEPIPEKDREEENLNFFGNPLDRVNKKIKIMNNAKPRPHSEVI